MPFESHNLPASKERLHDIIISLSHDNEALLSTNEKLMQENMSGLIFDLRDNPGGLLNAAVNILDLFIPKGQLLVWTEGKTKKSTREYKSRNNLRFSRK